MSTGRILVVGVGNSIMGDDGLGVRALDALRSRELPDHVDTLEAGTALVEALPDLKKYDKVVFVDAVAGNSDTVTVVRNPPSSRLPRVSLSLHEMGVEEALRLRLLVDGELPEIVILGLKPQRIRFDTELSDEVASKMPDLLKAILEEIR